MSFRRYLASAEAALPNELVRATVEPDRSAKS